MNHINKIIENASERKPQESTARWSKRTEVLVSALFVRFADLYGELAKSKGFEIKRKGSTELTREFQLWCLKLKDLDDAQFVKGIEQLEKDIAKNAIEGKQSYPPSYAEFIGLANRTTQVSHPSHRSWAGLPKPTMTVEARKAEMKKILDMLR